MTVVNPNVNVHVTLQALTNVLQARCLIEDRIEYATSLRLIAGGCILQGSDDGGFGRTPFDESLGRSVLLTDGISLKFSVGRNLVNRVQKWINLPIQLIFSTSKHLNWGPASALSCRENIRGFSDALRRIGYFDRPRRCFGQKKGWFQSDILDLGNLVSGLPVESSNLLSFKTASESMVLSRKSDE